MIILNIKTRTPIFTGDVKSESKHLRETGIMGSLRWWYEALVRGVDGGTACDPTTDGKCPDEDGRLCDACNLFGATGQARKFSLQVYSSHGSTMPTDRIRVSLGSGWYLPEGWHGEFSLFLNGLRGNNEVESLLKVLLALQAKWSGIGARNYLGYGVFDLYDESGEIFDVTDDELQRFFDFIERPRDNRRVRDSVNMAELPSLKEMFFCKLTFTLSELESVLRARRAEIHTKREANTPLSLRGFRDDEDASRLVDECYAHLSPFIPTAAHVRYSLRQLFRGQRLKGTITEFYHERGFGFISPDDGGNDIFVHKNAVNKFDLNRMFPGTQVEFDKEVGRDGRHRAQNVRLPTPDVCGLMNCPYDSHQSPSPLNRLNDVYVREFRHKTLGVSAGDEKEGAKIAASHLYKVDNQWQMRIWGYIPTFTLSSDAKEFLIDTFQKEKFWRHCFGVNVTFAQTSIVKRWDGSMEYKDFVADLIQR